MALVPGRPGEVTTAVSTTSGIPMLTLTGTGDALVDAARALVDRPARAVRHRCAGPLAADQAPQHCPDQDAGGPRDRQPDAERLRLGRPAARAAPGLVRRTGLVDGPAPEGLAHGVPRHQRGPARRPRQRRPGRLDRYWARRRRSTSTCTSPTGRLRSVNDIELTLNAVAPDGSACTPPSIPAGRSRRGHRRFDGHGHARHRAGPRVPAATRRSSRGRCRWRCAAAAAGRPAPRSTLPHSSRSCSGRPGRCSTSS